MAYESGINVFDLSEAYSGARAEIELGRILARRGWKRNSYIVTTKIYWNSKSDERGLSRKHILESVKASLQRLNLDYIDIIILHKADPMCPMEGKNLFISFNVLMFFIYLDTNQGLFYVFLYFFDPFDLLTFSPFSFTV